ncbi:hypothetical protein CDL12_22249 [Handroanthus impetiginosus]|uniref:Small auxin-up RNA n=1 Tax=Handroanthus impetiginosus TaxID=429701 RepID=A0A2G9GHD9_9LAMI|nr:hypothetical protein CDL12_22859 [Handroanthus impetiginosus]PIN05216.1 hypothetical protein CDL12_22249 [Handroanthus impetiginosus]
MAAHKKKGSISLKLLIKKLQNHLQSRKIEIFRGFECKEEEKDMVPDDVKEGQFAVLATKNEEEEPIRFVVELCVLKHPAFLRLLKMAEEEYGFQQKGTLAMPCQPEEIRRILKDMIWS